MNIRRTIILSSLAAAAISAAAVGYDEYDDIYYDDSKAPKKQKTKTQQQTGRSAYVPNVVQNYPDPSTYVPAAGSGLNVDVDEYNRRGQFLVSDTVAPDSASADTYAYTRRLEKYYNGDIINGSNDQELIDSYYTNQPDVNIYVIDSSPWGWASPWYYNRWYGSPSWSWSWNWGWNDPWYSWNWGPSWGWGPGYWGPGYWGPSWGWGGCPGWGGTCPPLPGGGGGNWAINNPGSSRPHRPAGSGSTATRRPGAISVGAANSITRPGNMGTGGHNGYRPGNNNQMRPGTSPQTRPSGTGSLNLNRGRNSGSSRNNNQSTNSTRRDTRSSWSNSSQSNNHGSFSRPGGMGGGSRSTHGTGGSRSGGGGGGSRGRGR